MEDLINDSEVLKIMLSDNADNIVLEDKVIIFKNIIGNNNLIYDAYNKLMPIYENNYNFNDIKGQKLINMINSASYLDNTRLNELLIMLHFNNSSSFLLNEDLYNEYKKINVQADIINTFISYNILRPIKSLSDWKPTRDNFICACSCGNLEVIEWFRKDNIFEEKLHLEGFSEACKNNKLEIAKYFNNINNTNIASIRYQLIYSCNRNYFEMFKWLFSLYANNDRTNFNITEIIDVILIDICKDSHFEMMNWFFTYLKNFIHITHFNVILYDALQISCKNGCFKTVKWIFSYTTNNPANTFGIWNTGLLMLICENGYLEILEWFLSNIRIFISLDTYNYLFSLSCNNGHFEIAKLLYNFNNQIDIHLDNDEVFRISCRNNNFEVLNWLRSIRKKTVYNFIFKWCLEEQFKYPFLKFYK